MPAMLIVSDTSPLNLLVSLGVVEILHQLFPTVLIPPEVAHEMAHPLAPPAVRAFIAAPPSWLIIRAPQNPLQLPTLDPGESAAISLAVEMHATLMVDERDGREVALAHGLRIVGAIGILERAANEGILLHLAQLYDQIRTMRFHVSDAVLHASLARHLAFVRAKK